jgi:K+-sensing histidine kinase KdpD
MRDANRRYLAQSLPVEKLPICTIAAPITVSGQKFGVLIIETLEGEGIFQPDDLPFIQTLADLIALAIERERLAARADSTRAKQQRERLESELLATLSHELRLPLTAIKGYTSALRLEDVEWSDEKQAEFLALIEEECDNMQVLMTEIIDTSIIDPDQLSIEPEIVNLSFLSREIAKEIQFRTEIHNLLVEFPTDFPEIEADPHRIRQVLRNILDNAIKYSPEGGLIVIQGEIRQDDIVVHTADQGIGISPEELILLFEKYHRAEKPGTLQVPGMGLGLPIARKLVESHGGRIWAESKPDQGTIISFSLPFSQSSH